MGISQKHFKIALLGMDRRSSKIIEMTLMQNCAELCEIAELSLANVVLLDLDGANYQEDLQLLHHKYAQTPIVAISIKPNEAKGMYFLRKPLSISKFVDMLSHIFTTQSNKIAVGDGIAIATKSTQKQQTAVIADILEKRGVKDSCKTHAYTVADADFFDPKQYTLYHVKLAVSKSKKTKKQIVVNLWNDHTILVDAEHGKILTDLSTTKMRSLGIVIVDKKATKVNIKVADPRLKFDFSPRFNSSIRMSSIDEFIWKLAFITARGRIPKFLADGVALNLQKPVYINEWPNFTRMASIPSAIPTVAYWIRHPTPLGKLTKIMGTDEKHINGLFFACHSIGIAGQSTRNADNIFESKPVAKHKYRNLFGAIIGHLKGK